MMLSGTVTCETCDREIRVVWLFGGVLIGPPGGCRTAGRCVERTGERMEEAHRLGTKLKGAPPPVPETIDSGDDLREQIRELRQAEQIRRRNYRNRSKIKPKRSAKR